MTAATTDSQVMCSRPGNWDSTTCTMLNASMSTVADVLSHRAAAPAPWSDLFGYSHHAYGCGDCVADHGAPQVDVLRDSAHEHLSRTTEV
ncbi:Os01g0878550 [Oryza sativa Japonica Group]|uniref:Os01g0878550 protein n=1 Tax=Oryza sativa subsp. japonica TaxID=39947 RepID=A0A0P0VB52_ORYSJ|nr:hypothetical protein EE612_007157 [Oryza sativa]BAS75530.1 Os01g0878550 [Oryza sativa Japonica Group]